MKKLALLLISFFILISSVSADVSYLYHSMNVRQFATDTGFNPITDVTSATCKAYWTVTDITSLDTGTGQPSDGDNVRDWYDQTSNNYDFQQLTASARPTYNVNLLNGQPGLVFDDGRFWMTLSTAVTITQPATVFIVADTQQTGQNTYLVIGAGNNNIRCSQYSNRIVTDYGGGGYTSGAYDTDPILHTIEINGTSSNVRNRLVSTGTHNAGTNDFSFNSLAYQFADTDMVFYMMIVYEGLLSSEDKTAVESFIKGIFGSGI